jgi:hypothetical protein
VYAEVVGLLEGCQFPDLFSKKLIFSPKDPYNLREVVWIFSKDASNLLRETTFLVEGFPMSK